MKVIKLITDNMWQMHINSIIQYFFHSSGELQGFNLFFFVTLYLFKCIDPDVPVYLLFLYTVVLVL